MNWNVSKVATPTPWIFLPCRIAISVSLRGAMLQQSRKDPPPLTKFSNRLRHVNHDDPRRFVPVDQFLSVFACVLFYFWRTVAINRRVNSTKTANQLWCRIVAKKNRSFGCSVCVWVWRSQKFITIEKNTVTLSRTVSIWFHVELQRGHLTGTSQIWRRNCLENQQ